MKSVSVQEFENNPFEALCMARDDMVVVMDRDAPQTLLVHLDDDGLLAEEGVRAAMEISLYRDGSLALGRAAKLARMATALFTQLLSQRGVPVTKGDSATLREDIETLDAWLAE
jgi:predicted HTH domain antitoxin